jgi:predicted transcriptional regulator
MMFRTAAAAFTHAAIAFTTSIAAAQQPAAPAMPAVPAPTCVKPEFPGAFADGKRFERFNKEYKTYGECIKKYVDETKTASDAIIEAGNKAIKEFNTFNEELAERQAAKK